MSDRFDGVPVAAQDPPRGAALGSAEASNTEDLDPFARGISFASAGALKVWLADDDAAITIPSGALAAGIQHRMQIKRLYVDGTDATGIVLYY